MDSPQVVIIGGGLAAVSAALTLSDHGLSSIIVERSATLGGRSAAHIDSKGRAIDIGQHVYLGCCTEYRRLLRRLGTEHLAPLERRTDFALIDAPRRTTACLRNAPLPYPFSLLGAIMQYSHLTMTERMMTLRLIGHARRTFRRGEGHDLTFSDWLVKHNVSAASIRFLWEPLIVAALNASPGDVSAYDGVMVIAQGLAAGATSASVGIPRVPLSKLLEPAGQLLAPLCRILTSTRAVGVDISNEEIQSVQLHANGTLPAKAVIIATAHYDVDRLLPDKWKAHPFFAQIQQLPSAPIVNVHLWFDRPLLSRSMVGVLRSPLQWLFDITALHGSDPSHGYHIAISISDARRWMAMPSTEIVRICVNEINRVFDGAHDARLLDHTVRKMQRATFSCRPNTIHLRPPNQTPVNGLFLAGDYTRTGWPSTMESAVRSGHQAALQVASMLK